MMVVNQDKPRNPQVLTSAVENTNGKTQGGHIWEIFNFDIIFFHVGFQQLNYIHITQIF